MRDDILATFQHQTVVVGVASQQHQQTVAVVGRLDELEPVQQPGTSTVTLQAISLSHVKSAKLLGPAQSASTCILRGPSVQFIGIPKS